jgi:hypothetical protein
MADKTVLIKLDVQEQGAISSIEQLNTSLKNLDKTSDEYAAVLKKIQAEEVKLASIQAKRVKSQGAVAKSMKTTSDATGSATAATMELSRVISDAPYGIRGMANNITQLVSQLGSASLKAGGLTAALKLMWKSLMGPLGVVFAITAAVSALDYFYGANEKSTDGVKEAEEAAKEFSSSLMSLERVLTSAGISQGDYNNKIRQYIILKKEQAGLEEKILETANKIEEKNKAIALSRDMDAKAEKELLNLREKKRIQDEKLAKGELTGKAFLQQIDYAKQIEIIQGNLEGSVRHRANLEQDIVDITKDGLDVISDIEEKKKALSRAEKGTLKYLKEEKAILEKKRESSSKTSDEYKEQAKAIEKVQKAIESIEGIKTKVNKDKLSFFKTPKELDLDVKSNEAALINFEKKIEQSRIKTQLNESLSNAKTEEERLKIKKIYDIKLLTAQIVSEKKMLDLKKKTELDIAKAKTASHVADIKRAFELYNIKIDLDDKLTPEQKERLKADAGGKLFDALKQADIESKKTEKEIEARYEPIYKMFSDLKQARFEALFSGYKSKPKDKEETDLEKWARYAENAKAIISSVSDFVDSEFDRQMTVEQNKTNALNNELNKRLLNENLSKEQKEDIQNQIAQNDEKLRVKQEKIARKRFKVMKAFSLATALADTYLATQKAYTSQLQLDPTSPIRAKIAAGVALAAGLANVAAIARTRFESSSGTSPAINGGGNSGIGSARAEPSFNIVGRSNENVLLSAIQSQFDQPLRAYVVARDVTNQQQLDGVISGAAST